VPSFEEAMSALMRITMSKDSIVAPYLDHVRIVSHQSAAQTVALTAKSLPFTIDLHYKLLLNESPIQFIFSDHPVVKYNQFMERRNVALGCVGFASKGLELFLPISPNVMLIFYDADSYRVGRWNDANIIKVDAAEVDLLNILAESPQPFRRFVAAKRIGPAPA
jgi:hypothetical protein